MGKGKSPKGEPRAAAPTPRQLKKAVPPPDDPYRRAQSTEEDAIPAKDAARLRAKALEKCERVSGEDESGESPSSEPVAGPKGQPKKST